MARLTKYGAQQMLLSAFASDLAMMPDTLYVALTNVVPPLEANGDGLVEPSDSAYSRMPYSKGSANWQLIGNTTITNVSAITWSTPITDWGRVVGWALCTDVDSGTVIASGELSTPRYIAATSSVVLPAQALRIRMEF